MTPTTIAWEVWNSISSESWEFLIAIFSWGSGTLLNAFPAFYRGEKTEALWQMHSNAGAPSSHTPPSHQRSVVQTTRGLEAVTEAGKRASSCINDAAPVRPMQCGMVRALAHFVTSRSGETLCLSVPPPVLILANYCATTWYNLIKTSNTSVRRTCDLE